MIVGVDHEWARRGDRYEIDVLGLGWAGGTRATATDRNPHTLAQHLEVLRRATTVVGQNVIDADAGQLAAEGVDVSWLEPKLWDLRLAFYAVNSHLAGTGSYDLRSIMLLLGAKQGYRWPLEHKQYASDLHKTCALDAAACDWAYPILARQVTTNGLDGVLKTLHECSPIFRRMREQGVRLDPKVLESIYHERKKKTAEIIEKYHLWEERGKKVVKKVPIWRSNKLLDIFEQQFGIRPKDRTRLTWQKLAGDPSLKADAKEFADAIIDLGQGANDAHWLGKATEETEGEGDEQTVSIDFDKVGEDGFIHPRYDLCGSPDRAVASGPNIQNFPRPSDDPRPVKLRSAVIPIDPSHVLLGCDFSSVETITNAFESKDMRRVQAALNKTISHEGTAKIINDAFGLDLNRNQGKACNHAFDKGESPFNLAKRLFKTERPSRQQTLQCQQIFGRMLAEYPETSKFRDDLWERAKSNPLVVTNAFGRKLMCFSRAKYGDTNDRFAKHAPEKKYWCSCPDCSPRRDRWKYAIAFLGRSCAFDALLRVMARIYYDKRLDGYSLPYMEVHDELDYSVPEEWAQKYAALAKDAFQEPFPELDGISLPADVKIGHSWAEAH